MKRCPFCNGTSFVSGRGKMTHGFPHRIGHNVKCEGCGASTDYYHSEKAAVAAWNQRKN